MRIIEERETLGALADEERRLASHEEAKAAIDDAVNARIEQAAARVDPVEAAELSDVARELKHKSVREAVQTEHELERGKAAARASQVVDYVFYIIYALIVLQFLLRLMGARRGNGFVQFVAGATRPLLAPFEGIVPTPTSGPYQVELSYLIALAVYILLHLAIIGALRLIARRRVAV